MPVFRGYGNADLLKTCKLNNLGRLSFSEQWLKLKKQFSPLNFHVLNNMFDT